MFHNARYANAKSLILLMWRIRSWCTSHSPCSTRMRNRLAKRLNLPNAC